MGLTSNGSGQVLGCATDRQAGCGVAGFLEELEMTVRMAGLTFRSGAEDRGNIVVAFNVSLLGEIEVTAVGLALAGKRFFQIVFGLGSLKGHHMSPH
jgi:hypothetical protein